MMNLPVLETERLRLRDLIEQDAESLFEYSFREEVSKYLLWLPHTTKQDAIDEINKYKANEQMMQWAVTLKEHNKLIGIGGFGIVDKKMRKADLGFSFNPQHWNKGYATEMTRALLQFGFVKMDFVRIQGAVHPDNIASIKTLEKSGLYFEATLKNWMIINDQPVDTNIYALTSEEYLKDTI